MFTEYWLQLKKKLCIYNSIVETYIIREENYWDSNNNSSNKIHFAYPGLKKWRKKIKKEENKSDTKNNGRYNSRYRIVVRVVNLVSEVIEKVLRM